MKFCVEHLFSFLFFKKKIPEGRDTLRQKYPKAEIPEGRNTRRQKYPKAESKEERKRIQKKAFIHFRR
jgi:hypothetical protein